MNRVNLNLVAGLLGLIAAIVVVGGIVLALSDKTIPEALVAIGSGAAGALASLLAATRSSDG